MNILALATTNQGKVKELRELLAHLPIEIRTVTELTGDKFDVDETEDSFEGNARLKAEAALRATGQIVMADDSGLMVDALAGGPGVRSARYAGPGASDAQNLTLLLQELRGVPARERGARFVCAIALVGPGLPLITVRGTLEGAITDVPSGSGGFGYDPVFVPSGYAPRTLAELTGSEKNAISHRSRALAELRGVLGSLPLSLDHVKRLLPSEHSCSKNGKT